VQKLLEKLRFSSVLMRIYDSLAAITIKKRDMLLLKQAWQAISLFSCTIYDGFP
jgi:hypothetical protein